MLESGARGVDEARMSETREDRKSDSGRPYVALLFADLCDSTGLGEAIDPEESVRLRQQLEDIALQVVSKHGGRVIQVYGDGVLAVFGYPTPQEDDARRAVEAAIELHEAVRRAVWIPAMPTGFEVRLHSGVHAGRVFAREGDELHGRYELVGPAVNTAAKLCEAAARDEILVSDAVLNGIEAFFLTELAAPIPLKGKQGPLETHRVRGRSDVSSRFEARARDGLTAFVGREAELRTLEEVVADCSPGEPGVALVSGPPGIGKTRIFDELRRRVSGSGTRVLYASCDNYGEMPLFGPFLQVLRHVFALEHAEEDPAAIRQVQQRVRELGPPVEAQADRYLELLSLRPWRSDAAGRAEHEHVARAFVPLFAALAARERLLLVLDDWQWADDASREVLDQIRRTGTDRGACILVGARAGGLPETGFEDVDGLMLQPFSEAESAKMIRALRPNILDLGVTRAIHARTGGNPLFLEELCRSLPTDALAGERALEESGLSTTLQGLIQARVNSLPAAHARVLGAAAVVGNEFSAALVSKALPDEKVEKILEELCHGDLIREVGLGQSFRFRHGIMREVIYETVRLAERRHIHRAIAVAIEEGSSKRESSDPFEALAYHYRGCADFDRAARYSELAGDRASASFALDRARFHYSTALSELDKIAPTVELKRRWLRVYSKWAGVYVYSASRQQLETAQQGSRYAADVGDEAGRVYAEHWRGWMHYVLGEYGEAIEATQQALLLAERLGDDRLVAQLSATLGQCHAAAGERDEALAFLGRGLQLKRIRAGGRQRASLPLGFAYAVACRASLLADLGDFDEAHRDIEEALVAVKGSGHAVEGSVRALECMVHIYQGEWQRCIDTAAHCREITARVNSAYTFAMVSLFGAYARFELDATEETLQDTIQAVEWLDARGAGLFSSFNYGCVAGAFASAGDLSRASGYARRALRRGEQRDRLGETMAYRALARIEAGQDPGGAGAEELLARAFRSAEERGSRRDVAVTTLLRAELETAAGQRQAAETPAGDALADFERMGMPWYAARARQLLDRG